MITRLELLRREAGPSQGELAARIHYSAPVVSRLENGILTADRVHIRLRMRLRPFFMNHLRL